MSLTDNILTSFSKMISANLINAHSKSAFSSCDEIESETNSFSQGVNEIVESAIRYLRLNSRERELNRAIITPYNLNVVSLGSDCLPRTVLTRWGVKPPRSEGELSYPFDLAVHPTGVVANLLNSKFKNYLDDDYLSVVKNVPSNIGLNVNFNHETGNIFIENDFKLLKEKYTQRINNLYGLDDEKSTVFFHHVSNAATVNNLIKAVQRFSVRNGKHGEHLLCLVSTKATTELVGLIDSYEGLSVAYKHIPFPNENYVWHQEDHYSSPEGSNFERAVTSFVIESIKTKF